MRYTAAVLAALVLIAHARWYQLRWRGIPSSARHRARRELRRLLRARRERPVLHERRRLPRVLLLTTVVACVAIATLPVRVSASVHFASLDKDFVDAQLPVVS